MIVDDDKFILDACCGGRMFWFNKNHPNTIYIDNEPRPKGTCKHRPNFMCFPDIKADFRNLPFPDESFYHVVFDPPHIINLSKRSAIGIRYGSLIAETWQSDLSNGFKECWRVLKPYGTLVFKWEEGSIKLKKVLSLFSETPLYGHPTSKHGKTIWCVFMKQKSGGN